MNRRLNTFSIVFKYGCFAAAFLFASLLLRRTTEIYLSELDLFISSTTLVTFNLIDTFLWNLLYSFRQDVEQNNWLAGIYYSLPALFILLLVFAQYHFRIAAVILICLFLLIVLFRVVIIRLLLLSGKEKITHAVYVRACRRFSVFCAGILFVIPAFLSVSVYKMERPVYTAEYALLDVMLDYEKDDLLNRQRWLSGYSEVLAPFQAETWPTLSETEQLDALQTVADLETAYLGIPATHIIGRGNSFTLLGQYDYSTNTIEINLSALNDRQAEDAILIVCHEIYHAYQRFVCSSIDWQTAPVDCAYFAEAKRWHDNFEDYCSDSAAYYCQPVEESAREYAENAVEIYLSCIEYDNRA